MDYMNKFPDTESKDEIVPINGITGDNEFEESKRPSIPKITRLNKIKEFFKREKKEIEEIRFKKIHP